MRKHTAKARKKPSKASERRYVAVHLSPHLYVALTTSAKAASRSVAGQLRAILTDVYGGDA